MRVVAVLAALGGTLVVAGLTVAAYAIWGVYGATSVTLVLTGAALITGALLVDVNVSPTVRRRR